MEKQISLNMFNVTNDTTFSGRLLEKGQGNNHKSRLVFTHFINPIDQMSFQLSKLLTLNHNNYHILVAHIKI